MIPYIGRALVVAVGLMAAPAFGQGTVKIGLIMTYTGVFGDTATQMDNGIKLYMSQHGDTVAGKKIELVRKDVGTGAVDLTKRAAQELVVRDQVDILAGFPTTPTALATAELSKEASKLMVVMNAATSHVPTTSPFIVRTSYSLPQVAEPLANWAYDNGIRKVYTLALDLAPGIDTETAFQRVFKARGGAIIGSTRFPVSNPDFSVFVARAQDANPDAIFVFVPGGEQPAALGKALAERGVTGGKIKVIGNDILTDDSALKSMGDLALGIITGAHYDYNLSNAQNKEYVAAFRKAYQRNPDLFSVGGYDGMHLIYEALKKTGGKADGPSLVEAAKGMSWDSPRGPMLIDPATRDVVQTIYIRRVEKVDGALVNVDFARFNAVKASDAAGAAK
jgi:branched-chain amino acid transport system substrate-binding protein